MVLTVKFVGALRHVSGTEEIAFICKSRVALRDLMSEIVKELPKLKRSLMGQQLEEPRPNALILVNGREISVLDGLETKLNDGDEVVLVPFVHGG